MHIATKLCLLILCVGIISIIYTSVMFGVLWSEVNDNDDSSSSSSDFSSSDFSSSDVVDDDDDATAAPTAAPPTPSPTPVIMSGFVQVNNRFVVHAVGDVTAEPFNADNSQPLFAQSLVQLHRRQEVEAPASEEFILVEEGGYELKSATGASSLWSVQGIYIDGERISESISLGASDDSGDSQELIVKRNGNNGHGWWGRPRRSYANSDSDGASEHDDDDGNGHGGGGGMDDDDDAGGYVPCCGIYDVPRGHLGVQVTGLDKWTSIHTKTPSLPFDVNSDAKVRGFLKVCGNLIVKGTLVVNGTVIDGSCCSGGGGGGNASSSEVTECNVNTVCAAYQPAGQCMNLRCVQFRDFVSSTTTQMCLLAPKTVGSACDDGQGRTVNDICVAGGECRGTPERDLLEECTVDQEQLCAEKQCQALQRCFMAETETTNPTCIYEADPSAEGDACSDNNPFTVQDACNDNGECVGVPVVPYLACDDDQAATCPTPRLNGCKDVFCEVVAGDVRCALEARENGIACDDGLPFTVDDTCDGGDCIGTYVAPTAPPTSAPTAFPTAVPTELPTAVPTASPTMNTSPCANGYMDTLSDCLVDPDCDCNIPYDAPCHQGSPCWAPDCLIVYQQFNVTLILNEGQNCVHSINSTFARFEAHPTTPTCFIADVFLAGSTPVGLLNDSNPNALNDTANSTTFQIDGIVIGSNKDDVFVFNGFIVFFSPNSIQTLGGNDLVLFQESIVIKAPLNTTVPFIETGSGADKVRVCQSSFVGSLNTEGGSDCVSLQNETTAAYVNGGVGDNDKIYVDDDSDILFSVIDFESWATSCDSLPACLHEQTLQFCIGGRACFANESEAIDCDVNNPAPCRHTNCFLLPDKSSHCKDGPDYTLNGAPCEDYNNDNVAGVCENGVCVPSTGAPTVSPTRLPTAAPTNFPTKQPTKNPTPQPTTKAPTAAPTEMPTPQPTIFSSSPCDTGVFNLIPACLGAASDCNCSLPLGYPCHVGSPCLNTNCIVLDETNFQTSLTLPSGENCILVTTQESYLATSLTADPNTPTCIVVNNNMQYSVIGSNQDDVIVIFTPTGSSTKTISRRVSSLGGNDLVAIGDMNLITSLSNPLSTSAGNDVVKLCDLSLSFNQALDLGDGDDCVAAQNVQRNGFTFPFTGGNGIDTIFVGTLDYPTAVNTFEQWAYECGSIPCTETSVFDTLCADTGSCCCPNGCVEGVTVIQCATGEFCDEFSPGVFANGKNCADANCGAPITLAPTLPPSPTPPPTAVPTSQPVAVCSPFDVQPCPFPGCPPIDQGTQECQPNGQWGPCDCLP